MIKNILIISHSNIGDVCYDLAVVSPLRRQFPQAKISFFTSKRAENIVRGYKGINEVIVFDKEARGRSARGRLQVMCALAKARFDLAIVLKRTLMPYFLGIPRVWNIRRDLKTHALEHVVDSYLEFLFAHGIERQKAEFGFALGKEEDDFSKAFFAKEGITEKERLVGIFPLAAWSVKNWPVDKWNELAGLLQGRYGIKVIAFGKYNGDPYNKMVLANISRKIIFAQTPALKQAMALIKRCSVFIGPDSSLLHLASCIGSEVIGLYGPTSREYIYPYFHRQNIITAKKNLDCMPCYPRQKFCPCKKNYSAGTCMENIGVEDVLAAVCQKLNLA
ncbi:MAG: hypothetical protein COV72_01775 [Candidatus Omnitrophica bacterium CG11_big_fil_rev_8_21_14_0_20_42_13]|uniref:Lipopolysaccharide heptosyltransferase II n=1 Tax=Candidatus Ghiorseimicrobium undicola TaxID=1974746 RepID=A0A2H0LZ55_9BACT|nr:MAG: hypothetical protein COV72_01775 [Candidatus Omnitrophica bacterium CG11_big_fil_rev_8_21_14_0_20_42_13]